MLRQKTWSFIDTAVMGQNLAQKTHGHHYLAEIWQTSSRRPLIFDSRLKQRKRKKVGL